MILILFNTNKYMKFKSPFHYTKYNFTSNYAKEFTDEILEYVENNIKRYENIIKISNIINDINKAMIIEKSILEYTLIYCIVNNHNNTYIKYIYDDKTFNIIQNINKYDKLLKNNIKNNKINLTQIAFMTPLQLNPNRWTHYIKKKEYIENREKNIKYSDAYKCYKCGESKCNISFFQTRSADEPITTFITCLVCKNTFKM
jgi:DNA-directed RNA polymerase subunit M/transcription elongation factor TFIIS